MNHTITFNGETLTVVIGKYQKPTNIAIVLYDAHGLPYMRASSNPEYTLEKGEVAIKDWSENRGILEALIEARIVEDTGATIPSGFVDLILCRLLIKGDE